MFTLKVAILLIAGITLLLDGRPILGTLTLVVILL